MDNIAALLAIFWIGFATWGIHEITGIESKTVCFILACLFSWFIAHVIQIIIEERNM